jgi:hypothetical protein
MAPATTGEIENRAAWGQEPTGFQKGDFTLRVTPRTSRSTEKMLTERWIGPRQRVDIDKWPWPWAAGSEGTEALQERRARVRG